MINNIIDAYIGLTAFLTLFMVIGFLGQAGSWILKKIKIKLYTYYLRRFHHFTKDCAKEIAHNIYD